MPSLSRPSWLVIAVLVLGAGLLSTSLRAHIDDSDAQLYQVVARHMVQDDTWTELRYLPSVHPHYREHLPFGLWPFAATIRLLGEWALAPVAALFSFATLLLVYLAGRRLANPLTGALAALILGATPAFFNYGGRPRLDPLLVLLSTLSVLPVLVGTPRARGWLLAGAAAGLAALVKGPFGLIALGAAVLTRSLLQRSVRVLCIGSLVLLAAAAPACVFLLSNALAGDGSWWDGYVRDQILASASGARSDGRGAWFYSVESVAGRFWPGLPFVLLAVYQGARSFRLRKEGRDTPPHTPLAMLLGTCGILMAVLCLPGRKVWNHALIAYPLLALLAAVAIAPACERWLSALPDRRRRVGIVAGAAAVLAVVVAAAGLAGPFLSPPCVASRELAPFLDGLDEGEAVLVVAPKPHWQTVAGLAAERRLVPYPQTDFVDRTQATPPPRWALLRLGGELIVSQGWREVARARGWALLTRS